LLLDKGADVNARDRDGRTALAFASQERHSIVAELLKARGAK
jgi:ankyrin repeat protein